MSKELDENDSFWSLDSMLPPKEKIPFAAGKSDVSATEIEISEAPQREKTKYPPITVGAKGERLDFGAWLKARERYRSEQEAAKKQEICSYEPDNPLIKEVTVTAEPHGRITERFVSNGYRLFPLQGSFEGNVPYDSVYPQYATLSDAQLKCYIGFRTEVRSGRFPAVDRAYIYLYLYELINLTESMSAEKRVEQMAWLIHGYRDCDDKLFSDMCNWLCDLCLIHKLSPPDIIYGEVHPRVLRLSRLREFYAKKERASSELVSLFLHSGRYDYRNSKYYADNKKYYDAYIENAVCYALSRMAETDPRFRLTGDEACSISRESFFGAYRTVGVRYTVTVKCVRITRSEEEVRIVSDLVKYAENCLRARIGIKQRLTVGYINLEQKALVKGYINENAPYIRSGNKAPSVEKKSEIPDYELLYEPKSEELTVEGAALIEERSWGVTEKLVTAFEGWDDESFEEQDPKADEEISAFTGAIETPAEPVSEPNGMLLTGLKLIADGKSAEFTRLAIAEGTLPEALADRINEFLLDEIGDVAVEYDGEDFAVAGWYTEDVEELLMKYGRE